MARLLERAARLYDLGMVGAPESRSATESDPGERFPEHTEIGAKLLADSDVPELRMAAEIALSHHERWDGEGFPRSLHGEDTPLTARIVAVALAFETARQAEGPGAEAARRAQARVEAESGRRFDPAVVEALAATLASGAEATASS
jgi:putative two-component system response regulator